MDASGRRPFRKRRRRKKGDQSSDDKGSNQVGHLIQPAANVRLMYPGTRFYRILCGNNGAREMCEVVFNMSRCRDFGKMLNVTVEQLLYCVCLTLWARQASIAIEHGYNGLDVPEISRLINATKHLQLPSVLANYIECLGIVHLSNGSSAAPWFATRREMMNQEFGQTDVDELLRQAGREVPNNYWSIDSDWIVDWNLKTLGPARLYMHLRPILWSETTGRLEMVVTPTLSRDGDLTPTAPQQLTEDEGKLGSIYRWRSFDALPHWPAQTALVCTKTMFGSEFSSQIRWSQIVAESSRSDDNGECSTDDSY